MTHLEAINAVEALLTSLEVHNVFGERMPGIQAVAAICKYMAPEWDAVLDEFESGKITPDQYVEKCFVLIDVFENLRLQFRTEKMLLKLKEEKEIA